MTAPQCIAESQWAGNCFRHSELSADGTCIVTYSQDERLRSFVIPPDLLSPSPSRQLPVYDTSQPFKSHAFALHPGFDLADPSTTLVLQSRFDTPIRLTNALDLGHAHASYALVNPTTEAFICPHSLAFSPDGTRFVAGSKELISVFDVSRPTEPLSLATRPGRRARRDYGEAGVGLSGIVSALAISRATGVLAAGSTQRQIALYEQGGSGERVASFAVEGEGNGVSQVQWDATGNYLFVAERQADTLAVFDLRRGERVCVLTGRKAQTTLRLGFDVVETEDGCDVWAGGIDGQVRIWRNVLRRGGELVADQSMELHEDGVSNVMVHGSQAVFFTSSGLEEGDGCPYLRAWTI